MSCVESAVTLLSDEHLLSFVSLKHFAKNTAVTKMLLLCIIRTDLCLSCLDGCLRLLCWLIYALFYFHMIEYSVTKDF